MNNQFDLDCDYLRISRTSRAEKKQTISLKIVRISCDEVKRVSQRTFYGINSTFTRIAVQHAEKGRLM